jgi:hypothetical protein
MLFIEKELLLMGCPKINLQVRAGNLEAIEFYRSMGYKLDEVVSMGKRLIEDDINRGYVKGSADFDPDALRARAQGCCSRKLISQNGNGSNIWHMTRRGIQSMLNDYRQKIGLPYNAHTLKRTFASNLHRKGVDVEHIMRLGGWGKLEIVVTYTKNMKFEDSLAVYNNGMQKSGFFRGPGLFCIHVTNSI